MTPVSIVFLIFFALQGVLGRLNCYHCISQVPLELVQQEARDAFKNFMFSKFNIPPSHEQCNDSEAYEFSTVGTQSCAQADHCIKTTVQEMGFLFVMRGCLSMLYKPRYQISTNVSCTPPSATCLCETDLCNTATSTSVISVLFLLPLFY